jgi:hypothetical protein
MFKRNKFFLIRLDFFLTYFWSDLDVMNAGRYDKRSPILATYFSLTLQDFCPKLKIRDHLLEIIIMGHFFIHEIQ